MNTPDISYHTKNRIAAVDIVRLLAAFAVMYEHSFYLDTPDGNVIAKFIQQVFTQLSPLFFVLAGYFACRNITWKKALNNAWWSFAPFVLWNSIYVVSLVFSGYMPQNENVLTLYGFDRIVIPQLDLFPDLQSVGKPANEPLWFMRDLIFLFLLSPFLAKWSRIIFPILLVASLVPHFSTCFELASNTLVMSPRALTFFAGGCLLQTLSKERQKKILSYYNPAIIFTYVVVMPLDFMTYKFICSSQSLDLLKSTLAIWVIYQIARWLEVKSALVRDFSLKYAPVTFLTFAAHMLIFNAVGKIIGPRMPLEAYRVFCMFMPIVSFVTLALFFFCLKRWCRPSLHLVAHYKLRPDDIKPEGKANTNPS